MINAGRVQGSLECSQPVVMGLDTVYEHTNVVKIGEDMYEYNEIQYSHAEWMQKISNDNIMLANAVEELISMVLG